MLTSVPTLICLCKPFSCKACPGINCRVQNPDIPRAGKDGAAHGGTAGQGGDGQDGTSTGRSAQEITAPLIFQTIEKTALGVSLVARTKETLCKPMEEQNPRLPSGLSTVCLRDDGRSPFLVADQYADAYLSL